MNTKCPNCGAMHSLDSLLAADAASELLGLVAALDADVGKAALRYLGLFRPAKSQLSYARAAKLLGELVPDITLGSIRREHRDCPAPPEAWLYGFQTALEARDAGRLKLPLKSHGWLYEVIAGWQTDTAAPAKPPTARPPKGVASRTVAAAAALEGMRRET